MRRAIAHDVERLVDPLHGTGARKLRGPDQQGADRLDRGDDHAFAEQAAGVTKRMETNGKRLGAGSFL